MPVLKSFIFLFYLTKGLIYILPNKLTSPLSLMVFKCSFTTKKGLSFVPSIIYGLEENMCENDFIIPKISIN